LEGDENCDTVDIFDIMGSSSLVILSVLEAGRREYIEIDDGGDSSN
jgi:hypothetical protein